MRELVLALAACVGINFLAKSLRPRVPPGASALHIDPAAAVETASFLALGMRRLAADLGLIRMMIYYGSPEAGHEEHHHGGLAGFDPEHPELSYGGGEYPELGRKAREILDMDPAFEYAVLYAAGALAFNLNKPQDALDLLEYALKRDPKNHQYQAYIGAVGFHRHGNPEGVIRLLKPLLASPDCPTMIKGMMAFLYKRSGHKAEAIKLYREIYETSRDSGYRGLAERMLKELKATVR